VQERRNSDSLLLALLFWSPLCGGVGGGVGWGLGRTNEGQGGERAFFYTWSFGDRNSKSV